jgi:hypothetical protein
VVLEVRVLGPPDRLGGLDELVLGPEGGVGAARDLDGAAVTVGARSRALAEVRLKILHVGQQVVSRPARHGPGVEVAALGAAVHHEVDGRAAAQRAANGHGQLPVPDGGLLDAHVGNGGGAAGHQVVEEEQGFGDIGDFVFVLAGLDHEDDHAGVGIA